MRPQAPRLPEVTSELKLSSEGLAPSPGTEEEDDQTVLGDSDTLVVFNHVVKFSQS